MAWTHKENGGRKTPEEYREWKLMGSGRKGQTQREALIKDSELTISGGLNFKEWGRRVRDRGE